MNDFFKNALFQKALATGLDFALSAGEKLQVIVADVIEKGKNYQESRQSKTEETASSEQEQEIVDAAAAEAATDASPEAEDKDNSEAKANRWEEYEQRLRKLVEAAVAKFNLIRNNDQASLEARVSALEEKLSIIAQQIAGSNDENEKRQ